MLIPVALSSVSAAALALFVYFPYRWHLALHSDNAPALSYARTGSAPGLNLHHCARVAPAGAAFCDDVVIHRPSGMAYMSCDESRLWWDPVKAVWQQPPAHAGRNARMGGAIWAWDLEADTLPRKLFISHPSPGEHFHPTGLAVTTADSSERNSTSPSSILLLVANHPKPGAPGVVDVLVHDLSGTGGRASNVARHHTRIEGSALGESGTANPYRLSIFAEQYSPPIAAHEGPDRKLRVPSFFHTSVPARESPDVPVQGKSLSPLAHIRTFLSPAARARVSLFLARGNVSKEVIWGVSSWPGFAPVAKAWDGGGNRAGANSSAHTMIVLGVGGGDASVQEWDQHWVRVEDGVEDVDDPYADQSASVGVKSKLRLYTPSFINFFGKTLDYPATSLDVDALGRFWTAGSGDTAAVDAWVAYLREAGGQSRSGSDAIRPGSRVEQTTFVHRAGPSVAHPWELERLARVRARGMFLPKEHLGLPIFSAPSTRGSEPFKPLSNNAKGEEMGFLPTAPTGIAVDHARGIVLVVGAYEERGVAMCAMPEGWAEM